MVKIERRAVLLFASTSSGHAPDMRSHWRIEPGIDCKGNAYAEIVRQCENGRDHFAISEDEFLGLAACLREVFGYDENGEKKK